MKSSNILTVFLLSISLIFSTSSIAINNDNNAMINQIYYHFNKAFETLNSQEMLFIYTQNAAYISDNESKEIILGRHDIITQYRTFFKKISAKKANVDVDFRILKRHIEGSSATDIGYYLIRYYPHADDEEPISEFAGKFVGVAKKSADGHWYLVLETNNKANTAFYYNAKPQPNLYYGRQFPPISTGLINTHD